MLGQNIGRVGLPDMSSGGRPSLTLDFVGIPVLNERVTFSRPSGATWFNSAGVLQGVDFSVTSNTIGTGSKTFTLDATAGVNRYWATGDSVLISQQSNSSNNMSGTVTSYTASTQTLVVNVTSTGGSGTIASWRIGSTMPRFDYNPDTLAARGLLIEEQRTNSILQSQTFQTTWAATRSSVSADTAVAPDGTTTADSIVEDGTAANTHDLRQGGVSNSATTNWTLSFFLKAVNRTWALIELQNATATSNRARAWFNLQTGVVGAGNTAGSGITYVSHSIQNIGNGWYRCVVVGTVDVSVTSIQAWVEGTTADNTANYNGVNGQTSIYVWGAQLEAGAFPTSYIPTTVITATRSADEASVNTLSPWFNATEGTLFVQAQDMSDAAHATSQPRAASLNDGTTSNTVDISRLPASAQGRARIEVGGVNQFNSLTTAWPLATQAKVALAYKANDYAACLGGGTVFTNTASSSIPVVTALSIGDIRTTVSNKWDGWIQRVSYYPRRLANAELQSLTV